MSTIRVQLLAGLRAVLVLTVLTGVLYPLAVTVIAQLAFEDQADGSLVVEGGEVVGSALLGQSFTAPEYFHGRPSAAGAAASGTEGADPQDLTQVASGATNLGPTNPDLLAAVDEAEMAAMVAGQQFDDGAGFAMIADAQNDAFVTPLHRRCIALKRRSSRYFALVARWRVRAQRSRNAGDLLDCTWCAACFTGETGRCFDA